VFERLHGTDIAQQMRNDGHLKTIPLDQRKFELAESMALKKALSNSKLTHLAEVFKLKVRNVELHLEELTTRLAKYSDQECSTADLLKSLEILSSGMDLKNWFDEDVSTREALNNLRPFDLPKHVVAPILEKQLNTFLTQDQQKRLRENLMLHPDLRDLVSVFFKKELPATT
jgi:hypothetical protein